MKAKNLLDPVKEKPAPKRLRRWWKEDKRLVVKMEKRAEKMHAKVAQEMHERQRTANKMHQIGYSQHMEYALAAACVSVGVSIDFVTRKSRLGNLLRGCGRSEKRAEVFRMLRARGYSFPEIALAFGTSHSTVLTALKIFRVTV